jgi:hypothetical protein
LVSWLQFEPGTSRYEEIVATTELQFDMLKRNNLRFTNTRVFSELARIWQEAVLDLFEVLSRHLFVEIMEEKTNIRQLSRFKGCNLQAVSTRFVAELQPFETHLSVTQAIVKKIRH